MAELVSIILAAGEGTRMRSTLPKVLHPVGGLPIIGHVVRAAVDAGSTRVGVITAPGHAAVRDMVGALYPQVQFFEQAERKGTAHAASMAKPLWEGAEGYVAVVYGDHPMLREANFRLVTARLDAGMDAAILGFIPADPTGYGRFITDGEKLLAIREQKDASADERKIGLCNACILVFRGPVFAELIGRVGTANAQGEYYVTDLVELANSAGYKVGYAVAPERDVMGVNDRSQLAKAEAQFQDLRRDDFMKAGVTLKDPSSVHFSYDTAIGRDVTIWPNVVFGPGVVIADNVEIRAFCDIEQASIGEGASIGPFARIRGGAELGRDVHLGNFVEVKKSRIGAGTKAGHLSYLGDAVIGEKTNIGAGTITCNYDGVNKDTTTIGNNVFIGSNTALVAPVTVGDGAYTASGSVITDDVPADAVAFGRARQENKPGYAPKLKQRALARKAANAAKGEELMCGIVGIIGTEAVAPRLVDALKRLEYRGYDSAGVATLEHGSIARRRAEGKLGNLATKLGMEPLEGRIGIGHTRWATHGAPTEGNAHPHATDKVAVVHNGIIENFRELLANLAKDGYLPKTQTDTESVALWVTREIDRGLDPEMAVARTLKVLRGAFALAFMFKGHERLLIAARHGAPLAVGYGATEMYLGSDAMALAPFTSRLSYLLDGDWAVITPQGVTIRNEADAIVQRETLVSQASALLVDKGNHRHFMAKEIYEQPETISHTLSHYVDMGAERVALRETLPFDFATLGRLTISACGTAYYAGLIAKYWFERYARLPVDVDVASEFRYREPPVDQGGVALFISQSGETADTLAALRYCARAGQHVVSLLNVPELTIGRESEVVFPTLCGPEIGVASTKALTAQLTALASLVIAAGVARGTIGRDQEAELVRALTGLPAAVSQALGTEAQIEMLAKQLSKAKDVLYLGRGQMFPVAMEGALKLKEISYIHAEGYPAGELKHGPIALVDEVMPVIVVAPSDELMEKTLSNMQEVAARGGRIILVTDAEGEKHIGHGVAETIVIPKVSSFVAPILALIPVQLLAYHTAVFMGTDVDQPRNLAKSVTVE